MWIFSNLTQICIFYIPNYTFAATFVLDIVLWVAYLYSGTFFEADWYFVHFGTCAIKSYIADFPSYQLVNANPNY